MVLTPQSYRFSCDCGKEHTVALDKAVIAPGAMHGLMELVAEAGYTGPVAAVYDENTFEATAGRRPKAEQEVVLKAAGLHADEHGVKALMDSLRAPGVLLAIGAGTIHDLTRYCAAQLGIPFVSVPTAASVDGLVSTVAAMTWHGFKVTMPAVAPRLLVADLDVIAKAPWKLTCSGVGDVVGKHTSLCDWRVGHLLTGEYYCEGIAELTLAAVDEVTDSYASLAGGGLEAYASLTKALVMSGVGMQLAGNSRPASACEHHISHILEMGLDWIGPNSALHGEKVGVATLLCTEEYHRWAAMGAEEFARLDAEGRLRAYTAPTEASLRPAFGALSAEAVKENQNDCLLPVPPAAPVEKWAALQKILGDIPTAETVGAVLKDLGASRTLEDIGVDGRLREKLLYWSPYVRNRLTFMRLRHQLVEVPV